MSTEADAAGTEPFPEEWEKHADRCWEAERENAERLNERKRQLLTASAALFGLGLFSVQWLRDPIAVSNIRWDVIAVTMRILLASSLLFFGLAIVFMMTRWVSTSRGGSISTASHLSAIPADVMDKLHSLNVDQARQRVFALTYEAYLSLRERNARAAKRLELSQNLFVCGIGLVFLAVLAYICSSYPPISNKAVSDRGGSHVNIQRQSDGSVCLDFDPRPGGDWQFHGDGNLPQFSLEIDGNGNQGARDTGNAAKVQPASAAGASGQSVLNLQTATKS